MPELLDLNFLPVARTAGQDYPELQCLYAAQPPRRPARGRDNDRLALYLAMTGNAPLPPGKQDQVLAELARLYYNTPGSVTAGLRRVAEELNASLLERNLRLAGSSRQSWGILIQLVLRGAQVYLAHSGPAYAFLLAADRTELFCDLEQQEQGLGQSKATPVSFFQATLQPNDTLLLATQPSPEWSVDSLTGMHGQGPESLRRRLFTPASADLNAMLIQARPGKGLFYLPGPGKPAAVRPVVAAPARPPAVVPPVPVVEPVPDALPVEETREAEAPPWETSAPPIPDVPTVPSPEPAGVPVVSVPAAALVPIAPAAAPPAAPVSAVPTVAPAEQAAPAGPGPARAMTSAALQTAGSALRSGAGAAVRGLGAGLMRVLPEEPFQGLPSSLMAFIAIAIPVMIVAIALMAYKHLAADVRYESLLAQAQQFAERGLGQQDVGAKRDDLNTALKQLNEAAGSGPVSPAMQQLRARIEAGLDDLDLIQRVEYAPAIINGLPPAVRVTRLAVIDEDLYLLDGASGNVLRATLTRQGYQLDETFQCGAVPGGNPPAGPLVDIAAWPQGYKPEASLLGMDASGTAVYCQPDETPQTERLKQPSADGWGGIAGFSLDLGDTYVLDVPSKGVWIYWRSNFAKEGSLFFNEDIPLLDDVVDLVVNRDDLYLLHLDGSLTLCGYSAFQGVPTRCSTPRYIDFRPGRENMPLVPEAPFIQVQNTQPPDPSLFLLEGSKRSIYHFSLRNLAFQRQYVPVDEPLMGNATAFAVDNIRRRLFLAVGNQVYYAVLP